MLAVAIISILIGVALPKFANLIRKANEGSTKGKLGAVRDCDVVGRLGGDELAVVLVQTSWRDGLKRAQTIQWRLEQTTLEFDGQTIPLRVSIGYEAYGPEDAIDDLICRADMAMYYFKRRKQAPIARVAAE